MAFNRQGDTEIGEPITTEEATKILLRPSNEPNGGLHRSESITNVHASLTVGEVQRCERYRQRKDSRNRQHQKMHETLEKVQEEVVDISMEHQTLALKLINTNINVIPLNITEGDYVIDKTYAHCNHKLRSKSRGLMLVKLAKSSLGFTAEDMINAKQRIAHEQRMIAYPIGKAITHISDVTKRQAIHYDKASDLVHEICNIGLANDQFQLLII